MTVTYPSFGTITIEKIDVRCCQCAEAGSHDAEIRSRVDVPYFWDLDTAIWSLPDYGWTRALDAEPADVAPQDQRWRCPRCTAERACRLSGHEPTTKAAHTDYAGRRHSAYQACRRCGAQLSDRTVRPPLWLLAPLYRLRCRIAYARAMHAYRRACSDTDPMF
ncbi:hypothetical protein ACWDA3_51205 [Nonomuraea rubra]